MLDLVENHSLEDSHVGPEVGRCNFFESWRPHASSCHGLPVVIWAGMVPIAPRWMAPVVTGLTRESPWIAATSHGYHYHDHSPAGTSIAKREVLRKWLFAKMGDPQLSSNIKHL